MEPRTYHKTLTVRFGSGNRAHHATLRLKTQAMSPVEADAKFAQHLARGPINFQIVKGV